MEITRKIFWTEAMKGGTVIGLVTVAFALLQYSTGWEWLNYLLLVVFGLLLLGFTRRIAGKTTAREGFPYARCMAFVIAQMLFTGFINGIYIWLMFNFVTPDVVVSMIDAIMVSVQDVIPSESYNQVYDSLYRTYRSPLTLVVASIIAYVIQGGLFGLFTSVFSQRKPDIFASVEEQKESEDNGAE